MPLSVISYFSKTDETKTVETVPATTKSAKTDTKDATAKSDNKKDESSKPVDEHEKYYGKKGPSADI
ncbi:hypothetical protein [Candidatus Phytoplasma sp. AldY-WA1]|uniref:hypothetical protein n=1 Tax=Candidatus Phytoplasma sp. AldY-WA1 TaxID=2852100 RepID=UPI00255026CE|nr:hypothetical protein [Candidatus Phytoplasma sp. AldY-WA1]